MKKEGIMLSKNPGEIKDLDAAKKDREILRLAIIAELDAINLYEQLASITENPNIKKVLLDVAHEEKVHVGEFLEMLLRNDEEQLRDLEKGKEEIRELLE
ncbi:MAG: ferritin family protein [candidate division WOR-3 bacterium]